MDKDKELNLFSRLCMILGTLFGVSFWIKSTPTPVNSIEVFIYILGMFSSVTMFIILLVLLVGIYLASRKDN